MRKIAAFLTGAVLAFSCIPYVSYAEESAPVIWDGTADIDWYGYGDVHEYHITTAEQLAGLAVLVNKGGGMDGETFYLDNDIYLNDISNFDNWESEPPANEWESIGATGEFSGNFYGCGHTIYGMYQNKTGTGDFSNSENEFDDSENIIYGGLFGCVNDGNLTEINCSDSYIKCTDFKSAYVGGIAAQFYSVQYDRVFSYCTFSGKVIAENNKYSCCGGIAGSFTPSLYSSLYRCINYSDVYSQCIKETYVGGMAGINHSTITDCYNYGNITGHVDVIKGQEFQYNEVNCGGIAGCTETNDIDINNCINKGNINAEATGEYFVDVNIGGLTGKLENGHIVKSYNIGKVSATALRDIYTIRSGGLIGGEYNSTSGEYVNWSGKEDNSYFLFGTAKNGCGSGDYGVTYFRTEKNMKSPEFLELIGDKFIYVEGDFPQLKWTVQASGDVNMDGSVTIADLVMLQKFLLKEDNELNDWHDGDLCRDGIIDVYDLVALRQILIENAE